MCGIVGYTGGRKASEIIYEGLKRLEYRGYDSAGIATLSCGEIFVGKKQGRVGVLESLIGGLDGNTGVGHTRWATHGKPSDVNAHPHCAGKFAVVHNGIIENFAQLKERFFCGVEFSSQTDSEIIVRLLNEFYDGDLLSALKCVADVLQGSYALAVICADFNGLAVLKKNSPAIIGYGKDGNFVASDCPALAGECSEITILEDGDIAVVSQDCVRIYDGDLKPAERGRIKNLATPASLELGDCPHYMLKEIYEVPASVERTCAGYFTVEKKVSEVLRGIDRIIIVGCGTAYNSGLVAKRYIESFARMPAEAEIAGEFRYKNPVITPTTAVIAISQSGETADTVEAAKLALSLGAKVIAVTNAPYSALTRCADAVVPVGAGPEICVAATKSYTGQITALYLLAKTLAGVSAQASFEKLSVMPKLCIQTIENIDVSTLADMCARSDGAYFLGRDIDYAVALEGSLKLKEISYVPSEGYPAGELKHGTLALIDIRAVAVVIITDERLAGKCENAVEQVLSRKGKAVVITNVGGLEKTFEGRAEVIKIPKCDMYLSPLLSAIAVQLVAYRTALLLDRDPDKPRNLAKSVTVE